MTKLRQANAVVRASAVALVIATLVFTVASVVTGPTEDAEVRPDFGNGLQHHEHHLQLPHQRDRRSPLPRSTALLVVHGAQPAEGPHHGDLHEHRGRDTPDRMCDLQPRLQRDDLLRLARRPGIGHERRVGAHLSRRHRHEPGLVREHDLQLRLPGTASYTEVYATTTAVVSSQDESGVTYTATVTASADSSQDPVPSSPTGTVTFTDGATTVCASVPLTSTGTTTSTATCGPISDSETITAAYTNTDGNFTDSSGTGS